MSEPTLQLLWLNRHIKGRKGEYFFEIELPRGITISGGFFSTKYLTRLAILRAVQNLLEGNE